MGRLSRIRPGVGVLVCISVALWGCGGPSPVVTPPDGSAAPTQVVGPPSGPVTSTASLAPGVTPASPATAGPTAAGPATPFSATVWRSLGEFPFAGAFEVTSVTATSTGYAAVGFAAVPGETYFGRRQGIVWTSADGRAWQQSADPAFQYVTPEEIVSLGDSLYVFGTLEACGLEAPDDCVEVPESGWAAWRSTGGGPWERLPQNSDMKSGGVDGVAVAHGNLAVFGWTGERALSTIWYSTDGVNWNATSAVAGMDPVTAVAEAPTGIAAFGTVYSEEVDDLRLITAFSADGVAFGNVAAPDIVGGTMQAATLGEAGLVGVGESTDSDLNFTGLALHSADGQAWTQATAPDGSFAGADLLRVHGVPGGYVALGLLPDPDDFGINSGQSWKSADGVSWSALAPFGVSFTRISSSAAGPGGVVVFTVQEEGFEEESVTSTPEAWLLTQ